MIERKSAMLPPSEWCEALGELTLCCAGDEPSDTSDRLRELNTLLFLAPDAAHLGALKHIGPARLEALLRLAAYETAVMTMMGPGAGYLVSRDGDGHSLATVALPGSLPEKSGSGMTPALALIGALALSMSDLEPARKTRSSHGQMGLRAALH